MSPEERVKFDFLAGLVHEATIQPLAAWLWESPPWTELFLTELLDDGFIALAAAPSLEPKAWLPNEEARALLASGEAREADGVWIVPTPDGSREFDESNVRAMFEYCAASTSHLG